MKKLSLLALLLIAALFMGCSHDVQGSKEEPAEVTALIVKNQSSFSIKDVKYGGKTAKLSGDYLSPSENCKIELAEKASGYVFFTLYDKVKNVSFSVRVNGAVTVEKGKTETLVITDNTLVIQTGQTVPHSILNLMKPAVLKVHNKTSWDIVEISYGGKTKEILSSGGEWNEMFSDSMKKEISIKILRKSDSTILKLTLKEEIAVKIGTVKEVEITNTTLVRQEGKTEIEELRRALGMSILTVINQTSAKSISRIKFAGLQYETHVPQGKYCDFEYKNDIEDYIYFNLENEFGIWTIKAKEKIRLVVGEEKTFVLSNETSVFLEDNPADKISSLIYAAELKVLNKSSAKLLNVTYNNPDNHNFDSLLPNIDASVIYWDYIAGTHTFSFEIKTFSGDIVKVKTVETIALQSMQTVEFSITDTTKVIVELTGETTSIRKVLGIGCIKIINQSTAKSISKIKFAGVMYEEAVPQWENCELVCKNAANDYIYFALENEFGIWNVKTKDTIKLAAGEEKTFTITDETPIIISGSKPTKIGDFINSAGLEVKNKSSAKLLNVIYNTPGLGDYGSLQPNDVYSLIYWNITTRAYPLSFEIKTYTGNIVKVKTTESMALQSKCYSSFIITDATQVIIESTGKTVFMRNLLGYSCLKLINQSSAKSISKIKFAGTMHEDFIPQWTNCDFEFKNAAEDYIYFALENEFGTLEAKTQNKVYLEVGEEQSFILNDETPIILIKYNTKMKMSNFINSARLEIKNNSSAKLLNVIHNDTDFGSLSSNYSNSYIYWSYDTEAYPVSFDIKTESGNTVKVKTSEKIPLRSKQNVSFSINDATQVETGLEMGSVYYFYKYR